MDLSRAYQVTKAFATYFELTNLAETNHRRRRRRAGKLDREHAPLPGSFRGTLLRMKDAGISAEDAVAALGQIAITPVFTAHPTEVARQTVLLKRRRIAQQLERLDHLPLTTEEAEDSKTRSARKSPRSGRPTKSAWQSRQSTMKSAWACATFGSRCSTHCPRFMPRSWNPSATSTPSILMKSPYPTWFTSVPGSAEIATAIRWSSPIASATRWKWLAGLILREYLSDVESLSDRLSSSLRQTGVSKELLSRLKHYERTDSRASISHGDRTIRPKVIAAFSLTCFTNCNAAARPWTLPPPTATPENLKTIFC